MGVKQLRLDRVFDRVIRHLRKRQQSHPNNTAQSEERLHMIYPGACTGQNLYRDPLRVTLDSGFRSPTHVKQLQSTR